MAIELTNSTVVKIIIRRGQNSDRKNIILSNGELGYVQDTRRLYIGDGVTYGGNPTSNVFYGFTSNVNGLLAIAENGDQVYDTSDETLYALENSSWRNIHPKFDEGYTFTKGGNGEWTLNENIVSPAFYYSPLNGDNSLGGYVGQFDFNVAYLSLCANGGPDGLGSLYFGNIRQSTVLNELKARVNIDGPLFVHDNNSPGTGTPKQIQFYSYYPSDGTPYNGNSTIRAVSGIFNIAADDQLRVYSRHSELMRLSATGYGGFTRITSTGGSYNLPNFQVQGVSRFNNNAWYDQNVTIYGNLSVFGEETYIETNITATSALSVVNINKNLVALHVAQLDPDPNQTIARFITNSNFPVLTIKDGPFVGVNVYEWDTSAISSANFVVSGTSVFAPSPGVTTDDFKVRSGSTGQIQFIAGTGGINLFGTTTVTGTLNATSLSVGNITSNGNYTNNATTGSIFLNGASSQLQAASGIFARQLKVNNTYGISDSGNTIVTTITSTAINTQNSGISMGTGSITCNNVTATGTVRANTAFSVNGVNITGTPAATVPLTNIQDIGTTSVRAGTLYCTVVNASNDVIAYASSDRKLKLNITPIGSALEKLNKINGVEFDWDEQAQSLYKGHDIGVIAQEVEEIIPQAVTLREDGTKGVRYEKIIPLLVQAIKELQAQIQK